MTAGATGLVLERMRLCLSRLVQTGFPVRFALVTLGFSQVFFNLIRGNAEYFPMHGWFHLSTLLWIQVTPLLFLGAVDRLWTRRGCTGLGLRVWKVALYAIAAASFGRQLVYTQLDLLKLSGLESAMSFMLPFVAGAAISFFFHEKVEMFLRWMSVAAVVVTFQYIGACGVWGPSWIRDVGRPALPPTVRNATPVLVVVFDELSYDVLVDSGRMVPDPSEFPAFAALASESAWFTQATTTHALTLAAIPALLSGKRHPSPASPSLFHYLAPTHEAHLIEPYMHRNLQAMTPNAEQAAVIRYGRFANTLPSFFETGKILGRALLDPLPLLPQSLKLRILGKLGESGEFHWGSQEEFRELLRSIRKGQMQGRVWYWHCSLPHAPFAYTPEGELDAGPGWYFPNDGGDHPEVWARYRNQVKLADRMLGRVMDRLKEEGLYEECLLVVTADHGLRTGGSREPQGYPTVRSRMTPHVPLSIRSPGLSQGVRDVDYQHVDLVPTLLDLLGIDYDPTAFDGTSIRRSPRLPREKLFQGEDGTMYGFSPSEDLWRKK